jgi:hypothetical protein
MYNMAASSETIAKSSKDAGPEMRLLNALLAITIMISGGAASAQEHGRIKRKPPTAIEAERIASDMAMSDSLLRKGDIVATDRGFFVFRGTAEDGIANDFAPVPNPLSSAKK